MRADILVVLDLDASAIGARSEITQTVASEPIHEHKLRWLQRPRTCLIVKKPNDAKTDQAFYNVISYLSTEYADLNIVVEPGTAPLFQSPPFDMPVVHLTPPESAFEEYNRTVDFAIALGGDGTILHLTSLFPTAVPPIISFSLGTLGFLLPYQFQHYKVALRKVIDGDVTLLLRMRLACGFYNSDGTRINKFGNDVPAMNEVYLGRGRQPHLIQLKVEVNSEMLTSVVADGLIFATGTGSTAYSLSAGGPIVHPSLNCILLTPVSPRSLSFRSILLPHSSNIQVSLTPHTRSNAEVSIDGRALHILQKGEYIKIDMSKYPIPCVNRLDASPCTDDDGDVVHASAARDWVRDINGMLRWNQSFRSGGEVGHFDRDVDEEEDGESEEADEIVKPV
ncbi:NAD+ kinase [Synchytrium microbalum]|uniref:NAD+ kinase n=1 Tax=Synchytrium microbalum TaxID=1806994 RepID=A0A507C6Y2_9FUNG|nr:NAD+ kinase [Synchytrium microbalum]TPX34879.1 NAD+ kinase [Synchytrium microbalum]